MHKAEKPNVAVAIAVTSRCSITILKNIPNIGKIKIIMLTIKQKEPMLRRASFKFSISLVLLPVAFNTWC